MIYGIALGSNLGDRLAQLQAAVANLLAEPHTTLVSAAAVYESDPVDCPEGSQSFLNTVIEIGATLPPLELLQVLQNIEMALGRPEDHAFHAPRTVDLDILYADDVQMTHAKLVLPHPRLAQRRFVLEPLAEIRPDLVLPDQTEPVAALLAALTSDEAPLRLVSRDWL